MENRNTLNLLDYRLIYQQLNELNYNFKDIVEFIETLKNVNMNMDNKIIIYKGLIKGLKNHGFLSFKEAIDVLTSKDIKTQPVTIYLMESRDLKELEFYLISRIIADIEDEEEISTVVYYLIDLYQTRNIKENVYEKKS